MAQPDQCSSWLDAIARAARQSQTSLPATSMSAMGAVAWASPSSSRRVTLRRSLRSASRGTPTSVLWGFWSDSSASPAAVVSEPDTPSERHAAAFLPMMRDWLSDKINDQQLVEELRKAGKQVDIAPFRLPEELTIWSGSQKEIGIEIIDSLWRLHSRDRILSNHRDATGAVNEWLPIAILQQFSRWLASNWDEIVFGTDVRPTELRDTGIDGIRMLQIARLREVRSLQLEDWQRHHSIRSADPELPHLTLERQADDLVVSWDSSHSADRWYSIGAGTEVIPIGRAISFLQAVLGRMTEETEAKAQRDSSNASELGCSVLSAYHPEYDLSRERLDRLGFTSKAAADFVRTGASRHPVVGMLRSSRSSNITLDDIASIIERLAPSLPDSFRKLRDLASNLDTAIEPREPWISGYSLARSIRERLTLKSEQYVDIQRIISSLDVALIEMECHDPTVAGACIGSPQFAPTVILNTRCPDAAGVSGRRTTLAHELCHMLFDRSRMRGLALFEFESPIGQLDRLLEMRANAFAIELLVPMADLLNDGDIASDERLQQISKQHQVSMHALAWHAKNIKHYTMS